MSQEPKESKSPIARSATNTSRESRTTKSIPIEGLRPRSVERSDESAAVLESLLEEEKAERKVERFFWIFAVNILADCVLFKFLASTFPDIFIALLSLVLVIGCAKWLEVPYVGPYLDRMFNRFLAGKSTPQIPGEKEDA